MSVPLATCGAVCQEQSNLNLAARRRQHLDAFSSPDLCASHCARERPHSCVDSNEAERREVEELVAFDGEFTAPTPAPTGTADTTLTPATCARCTVDLTVTACADNAADADAERESRRLCIKCREHHAAWTCRGCEWAVCNFCPDADGDESCPLCNLRTNASNVPWFRYVPGTPRVRKTTTASAVSAASSASSGVSDCSEASVCASGLAVGGAEEVTRTARAGSMQVPAAPPPSPHPKTLCRLCNTDLTNVDAIGAEHRENCVTDELGSAPQEGEFVRCTFCNMALPQNYALFHMLACAEVEREEPTADLARREELGRQLSWQAEEREAEKEPEPEDVRGRLAAARSGPAWLLNTFAHRLPYCGREVHELPWRPLYWRALGWSWRCEPEGPLNGLPCLECQKKYLKEKDVPQGTVLNADGWPARLARDGLFECHRLIDLVDGEPNRCSWQNGHICDGCERISCDPVFEYLRPLWASPADLIDGAAFRHRFRASLEALDKKLSASEPKPSDTDSGRSSSTSTSSNQSAQSTNQEAACTAVAAAAAAVEATAAPAGAVDSDFQCRLCRGDLTGADLRAHRKHCLASNRPPTLNPEEWVRCFVCNLTIEKANAREHMLVCERVTPEQLQRRSREKMGEMLEQQPVEDYFLPNWLTHHRQYCGQTVVRPSECPGLTQSQAHGGDSDCEDGEFEWEWVCEQQGDMNGTNCVACQKQLVATRHLPLGTVFNADGCPAQLGRDGLFECGRRLVPKPAEAGSALTCAFEDHMICDACARVSHEPAFSHMQPLLEAC